jgi:RNA polymerase sigma-70 factor (ECF subfamily)
MLRGMLLDSADAFGEKATRYRSELLVHCYRMLGTVDEAEDAVQEAFARAWQGRETFRRAVSLRAWLYRIATNVCLNAIESRQREPVLAVDPFPDVLLADDGGPEALYDRHESISLAFLTVLQLLPPRQRAVFLLRDVLSFRAAEVAALLEMSVPAVNSAHQRARATLRSSYIPPRESRMPQNLLDRYVRAWEAADLAGLVALLRDDAVLAMPPQPTVIGARQIGDFLAEAIFTMGPRRLVEVRANRSPAFAFYVKGRLFALLVLAGDAYRVSRIDAFSDARRLRRFDLAPQLDED